MTEPGFSVQPTPPAVHRLLSSLLELRGDERRPEQADDQFHGGPDPDFVSIEDVADELLTHLQPVHEAWAGVALEPSAAYGMRVYRAGSHLAMHLDRPSTHVVSSVVQVAQDVEQAWPLNLELDGRRHELVLAPGQMLLYEGATILHGREEPLKGRSFTNLFCHYRPVDWTWSAEEIARLARHDGRLGTDGNLA